MNSLIILNDRLQNTLDDLSDLDCHHQCLSDAVYSCQLGTPTALEQWLAIWTQTDSHCLTETEMHYQEGVQFVADTWEEIKREIMVHK